MQLFKGSAQGTPIFLQTASMNFSELEENTDYEIWTETYGEGTNHELKGVIGSILSADGYDSIGMTGATDIIPQLEFVDTEDGFMPSLPFEEFSSESLPDDWEVHHVDWYYKYNTSYTSGDATQVIINGFPAKSESFSPNTTYYKNKDYSNLFWTQSGGCFGAGIYQVVVDAGLHAYGIISSAGAVCSWPGLGDKHSGYPIDTAGAWTPRYRGYNGEAMFSWFTNTGRRNDASFCLDLTKFVAYKVKMRTVLCSFKYDDVDYFGCLNVCYDADDTMIHAGFWGVQADWWNSKGSKYSYVVNEDGTSKKAINPNYELSSDGWGQKGLPADGANRLVTGPNYLTEINGKAYGYATYALEKGDFHTCIGEWSNVLVEALGGSDITKWTNRVKIGVDVLTGGAGNLFSAMISNPLESILKVHTLPLPADAYRLATVVPSYLQYVQSGGCASSVSSVGNMLDNDGRIVAIEYVQRNGWTGRYTTIFTDWTNTQCSVYVPLVGEIPIKVEDVLNHCLYVRYRIDVMTGDFSCTLAHESSNIFTTTGNCAIPVTCSSTATIQERALHAVAGAIQSGVSVAASGSMGNVGGVISGITSGVQNAAETMQHNIAYSQVGGTECMFDGLYKPMLIIRRPDKNMCDYKEVNGVMSSSKGKIKDAQVESGKAFLSVVSVDLSGISKASDAEKAEIESLLKEGIWV